MQQLGEVVEEKPEKEVERVERREGMAEAGIEAGTAEGEKKQI